MPQMTPVRPELMRFDSSAISRGGQAFGQGVGQGLAQLGAGIGQMLKQKRLVDDLDFLDKAVAANTDTNGEVDLQGVNSSYRELGGRGDPTKGLQNMVDAGMITPKPTEEQRELRELNKRKLKAEADLAEGKVSRMSSGHPTQADAIKSAKESGATGYKVYQQGDGTWAVSLEFGDGDQPVGIQVNEWTEKQWERLADAVESGDRRTAINIAGALGIKGQFGGQASWHDLRGMYSDIDEGSEPTPSNQGPQTFDTIEDAEKAGLPPGTRVVVDGITYEVE